ncbi:hypothetical protein ACPV5O_21190 [Vibrio maritimus]|uniref:hypothetical protein n=1 Tax=Vibrio maritimus TaxID=990268 RepID=UPI0040693546
MRYLISIVCGAFLSACANTNYVIEQDDSLPLQVVKSIKAGSCFEDREVPESTINDVSALGYAGSVGLGVIASSGGLLLGLNNALVADNKCGLEYGGKVAFLDASKWDAASDEEIQDHLLQTNFSNNPISQQQLEQLSIDCNCKVEKTPIVYKHGIVLMKGYKVHKEKVPNAFHYEDMEFSLAGVAISVSSDFRRYETVSTNMYTEELRLELPSTNVIPVRYSSPYLPGFGRSHLLDYKLSKGHFSIFPTYSGYTDQDGQIKHINLNISAIVDAEENVYFFVKPRDGITPHLAVSDKQLRKQLTPKGLTHPL